ncbi:MAG: hemerythrin domain-containing protein [Elusimicrobiota bacterium]|nr:MAG: hemerythrin domain-containing protein [Elusimicrobiota bacterium]
MSVFKSLSEEHALLLNLVGRLERASDAKDVRNLLLVLLKALEAHENLEHMVFDRESTASGATGAALALIERQHHALDELREEASELLKNVGREKDAAVQTLTRRLASLLRRHFEDEERTLWPRFDAAVGRSPRHRLGRVARAQVKAMKKELDDYRVAVEDYLT